MPVHASPHPSLSCPTINTVCPMVIHLVYSPESFPLISKHFQQVQGGKCLMWGNSTLGAGEYLPLEAGWENIRGRASSTVFMFLPPPGNPIPWTCLLNISISTGNQLGPYHSLLQHHKGGGAQCSIFLL